MNLQVSKLFFVANSIDFSQWDYTTTPARRVTLNADITQIIEEFGVEIYVTLNRYNNITLFSTDAAVMDHIYRLTEKFHYDAEKYENCVVLIGDNGPGRLVSRVEVDGINANWYKNFQNYFL